MAKRGRAKDLEILKQYQQLQQQQQRTFHAQYTESRYHMDLPNPEDLAKLENLREGSIDIILDRYQKQSDHRMYIEKQVIGGNVFVQKWSPFLGTVIVLSAIGAGVFLISQGKEAGGIGTIITALAAPLAVFLGARLFQYYERVQKNKNS